MDLKLELTARGYAVCELMTEGLSFQAACECVDARLDIAVPAPDRSATATAAAVQRSANARPMRRGQ